MASTDEVIPLEYVYDEKKDSRVRGDNIFSEPYYKDDSDSNDGDPQSNTNLPSNQRSKRSKPNRRKSQYDEDNYALPDCESDGEGRSMKVVEQIRKVEEKVSFIRMVLLKRVNAMLYIRVSKTSYTQNLKKNDPKTIMGSIANARVAGYINNNDNQYYKAYL